MLEQALAYVARGWSVVPIRFAGTVEDRKRPLLESWEPYQKAPATEAQVRAWWGTWPAANIGLVMGAVSGLVALDLDGPNAAALLRAKTGDLPRTAAVQTGRGHHALYRHPGFPVPNRARLLSDGAESGVDIRGDGGYVVAPPSIHGNGRTYLWVVPPEEGLAPFPAALSALLSGRAAPKPDEAGWLDGVLAGVPEGQRNETAARLAGYWLRVTDNNREASWHALRLWNARNVPPMDERELRTTLESIARREAIAKAHENGAGLTKIPVIEGPQWADELRDATPRHGVTVPVPGLSALGALVPGDLVVLAGRPGAGKSTLAAQLCVEACLEQAVPTYIVSTEMTRQQWGLWMAACLSKCSTSQLARPMPEQILGLFRRAPIAVSDRGTIAIRDIRALAEGRLGLKLLVVDHIGRVTGGRRDSRVLEVGDVARGLKAIAKDLACTVVALCQLNRRVEGAEDKRPRLDDLRESGEIEQEADAVVFLWTAERDVTVSPLKMSATVAKFRHGELSESVVMFDKRRRRFDTP